MYLISLQKCNPVTLLVIHFQNEYFRNSIVINLSPVLSVYDHFVFACTSLGKRVGGICDTRGQVTVSMRREGETCHRDHYPTLFEEWQGTFYVQSLCVLTCGLTCTVLGGADDRRGGVATGVGATSSSSPANIRRRDVADTIFDIDRLPE